MSKKIVSNPIMDKGAVEEYMQKMIDDSNHRFKSWEHCYYAFGDDNKTIDELALHLAFYLASWGMYRGKCGIFWKDYKIHIKTIGIIRKYYDLRGKCYGDEDVDRIMELHSEIQGYYSGLKYHKADGTELDVSATDTLITKIMLGTIGCVPAMDDLFKKGFGMYPSKIFDEKLLIQILEFSERNKNDILQYQNLIQTGIKCLYPPMKIVDMYFWQKGFDAYREKKMGKPTQ